MMGSYIGKKGTWECDWPNCTNDSNRKFKSDLNTWYAGSAFCHYHLDFIHRGYVPSLEHVGNMVRPIGRERVDTEVLKKASDEVNRKRISLTVAWYDFWIGMYWDKTKKRLYILPIPCVGVCLQF